MSRRLAEDHVLVIAGPPGIGKTTLAHMLVAEAVASGFELVEVVTDIEEAWSALETSRKQVFYYDDFLGRTTLQSRLGKNDDVQLLRFMETVAAEPNARFILTTREHILQDATALYERLQQYGLPARRVLLRLGDYSYTERASIVSGHIQAGGLSNFDLSDLWVAHWPSSRKGYWHIVLHRNFNPRQIEWICGLGPYQVDSGSQRNLYHFALEALDDPSALWHMRSRPSLRRLNA